MTTIRGKINRASQHHLAPISIISITFIVAVFIFSFPTSTPTAYAVAQTPKFLPSTSSLMIILLGFLVLVGVYTFLKNKKRKEN